MCCSGLTQAAKLALAEKLMAANSIKVNATFHHSEINAMGRCKGKRNRSAVSIDGRWYVVGGIEFVRFCSLEFDKPIGTYSGIAEFKKMDSAAESAAMPVESGTPGAADQAAAWDEQVRSQSARIDESLVDFTVLMNAIG